ncbi:hypothetical protein F5146DRAFT_306410 [Armillaria mellea]|nr:hypothetical protein F5146DRAFT_306410 [Armillaria mellea]
MHYIKTTSCHSDSPLPTPGPSLSENRPVGHRPESLALTTTADGQQRTSQAEFRPYGRGGVGSRRPRVKPNKSELDPKDKPAFPTFKFPAKWRPKVPPSEQTSPASPGFYDGPWCGPPSSSQSAPSLPSSSRRTRSPMFTQRDLFLTSLWKKKSKKMTSSADSLSVTRSASSTYSGHSSSASGSSLASLSRPEEGDDSASEVHTKSFETPSSAPYSLERVIVCQEAGESTGLEADLPTTEITVVGMGGECDVLDAMRKLRMK